MAQGNISADTPVKPRTDRRARSADEPSAAPRAAEAVALALLLAGALLVYWAGNAATPLWDRDEPRFAQAAGEMLATGDFVVPRFNGTVRYDKPILAYYFFAAGMSLFGRGEFGARFFSGVFGALSVVALFFLARRIAGSARVAWWAAAMLAFAPIMAVESKLCTVDALLLFLLLLCFTALWRMYSAPCGSRWKALFWTALALAVLTKGPVALAAVFMPVVLMAILARDRTFLRRMGWLWGVPLFVAVVAPWVIMVQERTGGEFLRVALGRHVLARAQAPMEGHRGFPGFYLVTLFAAFFPWAFLLPGALRCGLRGLRGKPERIFLLSWGAGLVIVLELVSTKMLHYSLPALPALAILAAAHLEKLRVEGRTARAAASGGLLMSVALGVGAPLALWRTGFAAAVAPFAAAGAILVAGACGWALSRRAHAARSALAGLAAWLFVIAAWGLPAVGASGLAKPVASAVDGARAEASRPGVADVERAPARVALYGYDAPSLVFYLGGNVLILDAPRDATALSSSALPGVLVVSSRRARLLDLLADSPYERRHTVDGINLDGGRREEISVWVRK